MNDLNPQPQTPGTRWMGILVRLLLAASVLVVGWLGYSYLSVEPEKPKRAKGKPRLLRTRVVEIQREDFQTTIRAQGILRPHNEITLNPQVSGRIAKIHPEFEDGAFFDKGDILFELETEDLLAQVKIAKAQVARANASYLQEDTRSKQARLNWNDLGYKDEPNKLVLRIPQLEEAKANVESAEAQLERANRDLERAKFKAPFDGRVRIRNVGEGQTVGPGTPLATVFAIDYAEIRLPISSRDMAYLELPEGPEDPPIEVKLLDGFNEKNSTIWNAKIIRTEGALDRNTLELFAIARVEDPFGRKTGLPPLRIGQPVTGLISGKVLKDVVVIPREGVRELKRIYLIDKEELTLSSRTIEPLWSDQTRVVVEDPTIDANSYLSTTHLLYAPEGAKVEIIPELNDDNSDGDTEVTLKNPSTNSKGD